MSDAWYALKIDLRFGTRGQAVAARNALRHGLSSLGPIQCYPPRSRLPGEWASYGAARSLPAAVRSFR